MLNTGQQAAVDADNKHILVLAGAGTGKTHTMISKISKLVAAGADVNSVLILTFTNAAAAEMKERYMATHTGETTPTFCTFHGFCYSLIARDVDILKHLGYTAVPNIPDDTTIKRIETSVKQQCGTKLSDDKLHGRAVLGIKDEFQFSIFWKQFEKRLKAENYITFDTMCYSICDLFESDNPLITKYKQQYAYIFVDEFQDTDPRQWKFVSSFKDANLFVVGDAKQCQPAGTMVSTSIGKKVPIEQLAVNNKVLTFVAKSAYNPNEYVRTPSKYMNINACASNLDSVMTITTDTHVTRYTPNHITYAAANTVDNSTKRIVYLMQNAKGWYRIGTVTLYVYNGDMFKCVSGILASQQGTAVWVLGYQDTAESARALEDELAHKYNLPRISWSLVNTVAQGSLSSMYGALGDLKPAAVKCLAAYHRRIEYPIYTTKRTIKSTNMVTIRACNLVPQLMGVIIPKIDPQGWFNLHAQLITDIKYSDTLEPVYSLDINHTHSYIADGVYTHNSIYGFRGADSSIIKTLAVSDDWHTVKLSENYRSTSQVCEFANKIHAAWADQPHNLKISSTKNGCEVHQTSMFNLHSEAITAQLFSIKATANENETLAILCRSNAEVSEISTALTVAGIKHATKVSDATNEALYILKCVTSDAYMIDWLSSKLHAAEYNEYIRLRAINDKYTTIESFIELYSSKFSAQIDMVMKIRDILNSNAFAYGKCSQICDLLHLPSKQIDLNSDSCASILTYITTLATSIADTVKLYVGTIHSVKGLEFDVVHLLNVGSKSFSISSEEQRNLYYVGCTRAKSKLYIWTSDEI